MNWSQVNWAQVCAIVALVAVLMILGGIFLVTKIAAMHEKHRMTLRQDRQEWLRSEYARLAGESTIHQAELRNLIGEVHGMAIALKDALSSDTWDPEKHLDILSHLDAEMSRSRPMTAHIPDDLMT